MRAARLALLVNLSSSTAWAAPPEPLRIEVDARDAPRRLLHAELSIPVEPGPATLIYPRWGIQTYGAPATVVDNIVGLTVAAGGRPLAWRRDLVDPFAIHVDVPEGARRLEVALDVVAPFDRSDLDAATGQLLVLDWYTIVFYPAGAAADALPVEARLVLPAGWQAASALASTTGTDGALAFAPASLAALVDAPVLAGKHFATVEIPTGGAPPVHVDVAADEAAAAAVPEAWRERIRRVVAEAGGLFGGVPYRSYHFLVALSDTVGNDGLEHRESTDLRLGLRALRDDSYRRAYGYLVPHEYVHAWNGLYRLGAGLVTRDLQQPQTTELAWMYEGLTRYLNWVLAARAGILLPDEARDYAAFLAAKMSHRPGRAWRSLADTAVASDILNDAPGEWESLRRGTDYYDEMLLVWLEIDVALRRRSGGRRSLDDFCRAFFRPVADPPARRPYGFDDIVAALDGVAVGDWASLLHRRLETTGGEAPLEGLVASGWRLVYGDSPNSIQSARDEVNGTVEERFSIGVLFRKDGTVIDAVRDSAAWNAGLGPGMRVLRVDGRPWGAAALRSAVARDRGHALRLAVQNGAETSDVSLDDRLGPRYPHLVRAGGDDILGSLLRPQIEKP